ncbi:uncharacterized protein T551_00971 [Pneumocystis jirovecii RU7]|uniref:Uncharacterized protein n=1 Tax=Pneumocystis jirovecii (strain RU7) TaxID=1408657 RepID=A0A0W4ZTK2_PNEJ7|nr:uncharacterized protein T551_00971 [Pneumocystis jirovecii RU7]KTW31710.1 hypothetical protein T551_00971 [Pneumocystis jirovecii RU7]
MLIDLRFESCYNASLIPAGGSWSRILWVTLRDHVLMPFLQGFLWTAMLIGFRSFQVVGQHRKSYWEEKACSW